MTADTSTTHKSEGSKRGRRVRPETALAMPEEQWPEIDRHSWREALREADFLEPDKPASSWSPARRRIGRQTYGQWLRFLAERGELDPDLPPGDRCSDERLRAFVEELVQRVAPASVSMMVGALVRMFTVMAPERDWSTVNDLYRYFKQTAKPSRDKLGTMVPAADLLRLGLHLMDTASEQPPTGRRGALRFRDGLLVAVLICCPVRMAILEGLREEHGHRLVKDLERKHIVALRNTKADSPAAANSLLKLLRGLIRLALDLDLVRHDPSAGIKRLKSKNPDGHHTWSEAEIDRFEAHWPKGSEQRLALALLLYTAQRRSDVVLLGPAAVVEDRDGARRISLKQLKTGTPVQVPLHPHLDELLPHDRPTFLLTRRGRPYSADGFGHWFRQACDAAGLTHCSAHGLRKAAARRLAEAGCTTHEIAAITGHKTLAEVERYTRESDRRQLADEGMGKLRRHRAAGGENSF